jgi:hypothetical protein
MSLDEPLEPVDDDPVLPELPVPMSLDDEPLDPVPSEPELESFELGVLVVSRSLVVWPDALPLDPVEPVPALPLVCAKAGAPVTRRPAMPRPPTTPHPIFIRIPSLLLRLETDQAFVPWRPSCWLPER